MTNYSDDEIRKWAEMAARRGSGFVEAMGLALLQADPETFGFLNFAAVQIVNKHPKYLEMAKAEVAAR